MTGDAPESEARDDADKTGSASFPECPLPPLSEWQKEPVLPDWLDRPHMARKDTRPVAPSFAAAMDSAVRRGALQQKLWKTDPFSRLARRRSWAGDWLAAQDLPGTTTLAGPFALQDLPQHLERRDSGVIKPVHATNAWGVVPFERTGPFEIHNLFTGDTLRLGALLETLHAPMQRYMFPNLWQIEDLLRDPGTPSGIPDDWKAYAFAGQVALVLQVRRGADGPRYKFHDAAWTPVFTGKYPDSTDDALPPPRDGAALLDLAQRASAALPAPFCRIDMFETATGPVIGELTPEPGGYHLFDATTDLFLGVFREWAETCRALSSEPVAP